MDFEKAPLFQATSGIIIVDSDYWGKGIASAAHKARTWYAFRQLGLVRIKSAVRNGNEGSLKALERSGYGHVYTERNTSFVDGAYRHQYNLECLNPDDWAWRLWWGDDRPTRKAIDARKVTEEVLRWAEKNVDLL
jgi:RimJ/RimL family protein N-acetyltransferase